jgi:hypothetical protein
MRGWALHWQNESKPTKEKNDAALALFDQALKIDPNDADALAGGAESYSFEHLFWPNPETDYDVKVIGQADRVIALAPDTMRAYRAKSAYLALSLSAWRSRFVSDPHLQQVVGQESGVLRGP